MAKGDQPPHHHVAVAADNGAAVVPTSAKVYAVLFYVSAFLAMVAGMAGKAFYDHLTKHQTDFEINQIYIPLTISPIVFGLILSAVRTSEPLPALILAFQNGFFWQDIFNGLKAP